MGLSAGAGRFTRALWLRVAGCAQVYQPCVLASKKRYVGFMFESPGQVEPAFDAKGIETVRRDTCPVVAKMLERSIRILFSTHDLSLVSRMQPRTHRPSAHARPRLRVQRAAVLSLPGQCR